MPLHHDIGEVIEGMDDIFHVVPVSKYAEQPRLTTIVKRMSTGKFKRAIDVEMPIFQAAIEWARECFMNSGIAPGSSIDCVCQEYPRTGHVAFVFCAIANGNEMFVPAPFKLGKNQIADLTLRDLWRPYTVN